MLIIGLLISIVLMGVLGGFLAKLLDRYKIIAWIGLALIAWIGIELLWEGAVIANATLELGLPLPAPHAAADH
jgi:predicted tellurium resistance membrane protein TerC